MKFHPPIYLFIFMSVCVSIYLPMPYVHLSPHLSTRPYIYFFTYLPTHLHLSSIHLSTCLPPFCLPMYTSFFLTTYLYIYLSIYGTVWIELWKRVLKGKSPEKSFRNDRALKDKSSWRSFKRPIFLRELYRSVLTLDTRVVRKGLHHPSQNRNSFSFWHSAHV